MALHIIYIYARMKRLFFLGMALLASFAAEAKSVVFTLTDGTLDRP